MKFEIVTAERQVYSDDVDIVIAPATEGQIAILPHHAALITTLDPGELIVRKGSNEVSLVISGGFLDVRDDKVILLADTAERADEIDVERAQQARLRAEQRLKDRQSDQELARAEASLRRSLVRLRISEKRRRRDRVSPLQ